MAAAYDTNIESVEDDEDRSDRLQGFVAKLADEARRRVDRRLPVEDRWIEDLEQYHGRYDATTLSKLIETEGSQVFINTTAAKTDALAARLMDLLFPTDDKNWGIEPTPVPDLMESHETALAQVDEAKRAGDEAQSQGQAFLEAGDTQQAQAAEERMRQAEMAQAAHEIEAERLHAVIQKAKKQAELMEKEIEDQLVESRFPAEARDTIEDACQIGFGVLKGPILSNRDRRRWVRQTDRNGNLSGWSLEVVAKNSPCVKRVDPWSYFPDPDQRNPEDGEGDYQRHLMNKKALRKLAREDGMDQDAIRTLLREGVSKNNIPAYVPRLHEITGQSNFDTKDLFVVWEYTGPIDFEDLEALAESFDAARDEAEAMGEEVLGEEGFDPLVEYQVRIWFCEDKILKFAVHPLDSGESLYSVFTIRRDETSPFGFGVPWIMRHPQAVLNGAFRMMMDNSGLSTGPQIVIDKNLIEPEDGNWTLKPRKVWLKTGTAIQTGNVPFDTHSIDSHQIELANIVTMSQEFIDDVTAQPAIAQGEQGATTTKTAQGMALLMNSANVVFRRIVRNYDDDVTTPVIRRMYHWNMQFSEKEAIKGDYEVKARGSGVLLVREMQAQNLIMIAQMFGDHPIYGPMLKHNELMRQIFRAHMIQSEAITKTEREYEQFIAEQSEQLSPEQQLAMAQVEQAKRQADLEQTRIEADIAKAEMDAHTRQMVAQLNFDAAMATAAAKMNLDVEKLYATVEEKRQDRLSKERIVAVETAMKEKTGDSAGGFV